MTVIVNPGVGPNLSIAIWNQLRESKNVVDKLFVCCISRGPYLLICFCSGGFTGVPVPGSIMTHILGRL